MRVRSFRNTVLSFSILRLQRYCKAAGKQREGAFLVGVGLGGRVGLGGGPLHIRFHRISCFVHYAYRYLHNLMDRTMNADYMYPKYWSWVHIRDNVYPKSRFWVHIQVDVYPILHFWIHILIV